MGERAKKLVKRAVLETARATGITAFGRVVTRHGFNIIGFHGVSLEDEHTRFPTLFISPESFERRIRFLASHYEIVPLQEAIAQHRSGRIKARQVVLTFDDGFYNFLAQAVPVLERFRAPATVYIPTADLDAGGPTYNLLAKDVVLSSRRGRVSVLPELPSRDRDLTTFAARQRVAAEVLGALTLARSSAEQAEFCRMLGAALDVDVDAKIRARLWERLNRGETRDVAQRGFDLQLHTHSHRNVVENRVRVREEVRLNRQTLEPITGKPAVHFCYPLGLWQRDVWEDLVAEGVQSAVTTKNGPNYPDTPVLALRRYLTGEAMTDREFAFELSGVRWLAQAVRQPAIRYAPSEKRVRYRDQPDLY